MGLQPIPFSHSGKLPFATHGTYIRTLFKLHTWTRENSMLRAQAE